MFLCFSPHIPLSYLQLVRLIHSHLEEKRQKEGQTSALLQGPTNASLRSFSFPKRQGQVRKQELKGPRDKLQNHDCHDAHGKLSYSKVPLFAFPLLLVDGWRGAGAGFSLAFAALSSSPLLILTSVVISVRAVDR